MSIHQIIYTSCRRGIEGNSDGFQVYSYDENFPIGELNRLRSLFNYTPPDLPAGQVMNDDLAKKMPPSFFYVPPTSEDGGAVIGLNSYLGRDYMGKSGRFGNFVSHLLVFEGEDMPNYPAEYSGSTFFRRVMDTAAVNSQEPPPFLPVPDAATASLPGNEVSLATTREFLSNDRRGRIFRQMLKAFFEGDPITGHLGGEKIYIADTPENTIQWIAALHYALPPSTAQKIGFATYEYDPLQSESRLCGVRREGTAFDDMQRENTFGGDEPKEMPEDMPYIFIYRCLIDEKNYEHLREFYRILREDFTYDVTDGHIFGALFVYNNFYRGMSLDQYYLRTIGFSCDTVNIPADIIAWDEAVKFIETFAKPEKQVNLRRRVMDFLVAHHPCTKDLPPSLFDFFHRDTPEDMHGNFFRYISPVPNSENLQDDYVYKLYYMSIQDDKDCFAVKQDFRLAAELLKCLRERKYNVVFADELIKKLLASGRYITTMPGQCCRIFPIMPP